MNEEHWGTLKNAPLRRFVIEEYNKISDVKYRLIQETIEKFGKASEMLTPADQAEHMAFMVRVAGAKKGIELGVFTGYTSLCFAEALPEDGKLIAVDVSEEFTGIAHKYWAEAGVDKKIELRLDGGLKVLQELIADKENLNSFDFAYVDADKPNYPHYFDLLAQLLRSGGFIMFDNVLWSGKVVDPEIRSTD